MNFNIGKCSVMHCGKYGNTGYEYKPYENAIRKTESEKDFGVIISKDRQFKELTSAIAKKQTVL